MVKVRWRGSVTEQGWDKSLHSRAHHTFTSLVPRLLHRKTGREPGRFHHVPRDVSVRGFVRGFDNRIIAHTVSLEILPNTVEQQGVLRRPL